MDRAYATLTVKAVNEDQRIITGRSASGGS